MKGSILAGRQEPDLAREPSAYGAVRGEAHPGHDDLRQEGMSLASAIVSKRPDARDQRTMRWSVARAVKRACQRPVSARNQPPGGKRFHQRLPFDQLHHQEVVAVRGAALDQRCDVGVAQSRQGQRLLLEARAGGLLPETPRRQHPDRDVTAQLLVRGAVPVPRRSRPGHAGCQRPRATPGVSVGFVPPAPAATAAATRPPRCRRGRRRDRAADPGRRSGPGRRPGRAGGVQPRGRRQASARSAWEA